MWPTISLLQAFWENYLHSYAYKWKSSLHFSSILASQATNQIVNNDQDSEEEVLYNQISCSTETLAVAPTG